MKRKAPLLLVGFLFALAANAGETKSVKEIGKDILEDTKAAGRAIRDSEVGKDTAEVSKDVWRKVSKASVAAAKDVRDATVAFWNEKIVGKERERDRLKKENAKLREESR